MKKIMSFLILMLITTSIFACPVCEKQQPKLLQGITHGAGPNSNWDYLIIGSVAIIVVFALYYSIKWLIKPGEKSPNHIKYFILNQQ